MAAARPAEPTRAPRRLDHEIREFLAGDPIRGLAALWVVLLHTGDRTLGTLGQSHLYTQSFGFLPGTIVSTGGAGVVLFFVLSGYVITRRFTRALQEGTPLPRPVQYFAARALRIYPAFWVVLLAAVVFHGTRGESPTDMIRLITLQSYDRTGPFNEELAQAWTLPLEVAFYVIVPLAAAALWLVLKPVRNPRARRAVIIAVPVVLWVAAALKATLGDVVSDPLFAVLGFAPGVALAAWMPYVPRRMLSVTAGRIWLALATVAGVALLLESSYGAHVPDLQPIIPVTLATLMIGGLLLNQRATGRCPRVLDNRVLRWLGHRSYGIYVWHYIVISATWAWALNGNGWNEGMVRLTGITVILSIALADLSWRWVESPALALRTRLRRRGDGAGTAGTDAAATQASVPSSTVTT